MLWTRIYIMFLSMVLVVSQGMTEFATHNTGEGGIFRGTSDEAKRSMDAEALVASAPSLELRDKLNLLSQRRRLDTPKREADESASSIPPALESSDSPSKVGSSIEATPEEKSGIGNIVTTVKKKWVKIVEIVVPIAVGIPLLLMALILCCCCAGTCKAKREKRKAEMREKV